MKSDNKLSRIGRKFDEEIRLIITERRNNIDKKCPKEISSWRITNKILEYPEWKPIREKLKREPRIEDLNKTFDIGGSVL